MMKKECDNYPNLNHGICELNLYEIAVAAFFESRGLAVERLCTRRPPGDSSSPDFRVSKDNESLFLCEVKHVSSSTASLPKADWYYENKEEGKRLINHAKEHSVSLIASPHEVARWKGEIPYPIEGRNTKEKEKEYEQKVRDGLSRTSVALYPLKVTLHREDPFIWCEDEIRQFVIDIAGKLKLINAGQTPHGWHCDFGLYTGQYKRLRDHGNFIQNSIEVRRQGHCLVLNTIIYLGINWRRIEKNCHEAQKQIIDRLKQEHNVQDIARVVMLFIEEDLLFEYVAEFNKLKDKIRRHIQKKSPELSAVVFCSDQLVHDTVNLCFNVFHVAQGNTPRLARVVFDNGVSAQISV